MKEIKWGIIGLGNIAHSFAKDLTLVDKTSIQSVASRSLEKAKKFAKQYKIPNSYGSYTEILDDPSVDIIYIATPHNSHAELSIAALNAKKHVLCEKPLAVNEKQIQSIIEAAQKNGVFMMEAFWSKFNPTIKEVISLLKTNIIGEVNYINVDFSFYIENDPKRRTLNMDLAGGSLLDMGVYPIFLVYSIFGKPKQILATGRFHETGADLQTAAILKYDNGIANIMSGFASRSDMTAKIYGTNGSIIIDPLWHESQSYTIIKDEVATRYARPTLGKGYTYEIEECLNCINAGRLESLHWSHEDSLNIIRITDTIRKQMGLKYPFE